MTNNYNPNDLPLDELPFITCFNNGGRTGWLQAVAIADSGHVLGTHICSDESFMQHDLQMLGVMGSRHTKHYQKHYPDGYRMRFVSFANVQHDDALMKVLAKNAVLEEHVPYPDAVASVTVTMGK
jgi:hypothetical protein